MKDKTLDNFKEGLIQFIYNHPDLSWEINGRQEVLFIKVVNEYFEHVTKNPKG